MSSSSRPDFTLIPQPRKHGTRKDESEDLFSTLFSPPTPPASPTPQALLPSYISASRSRTASNSSSEFGSFISVPPSDDPLSLEKESPPAPQHNLEFFDKFTDGAAKANAQNHKVLQELLEHEDDPLYWLTENIVSHSNSNSPENKSGTTTPIRCASSPRTITRTSVGESPPLIDLNAEQDTLPARSHLVTELPNIRSSSLPAQNRSFSSVTSRLLSSIRPSQRTPPLSFTDNSSVSGFFDSPPPSARPLRQLTAPSSPEIPSRPLPEITHGTPFASHIYSPPSGAPGFAGDRNWNKSNFEFDEKVNRKSVSLAGRKEMTLSVLTIELADLIRCSLPALPRLTTSWTLLYSLDQHGISLNTLYSRCSDYKGGALVVVKDSDDKFFGVWLEETLRPSKGAFYGSGASFLWKLTRDGGDDAGKLKVFKWTGINDYVALCEPEYLSFGGGDGKYGLYLDDTLLDGSSAWCPTFANEVLCSDAGHGQGDTVQFECVGLEVWGVGGS